MDHPPRMSARERLARLSVGVALLLGGYFGFQFSAARDPDNRLAAVAIVAVLIGISWVGQAIRGRHDGPIARDEAPPQGLPVSPDRLLAAMAGAWVVPGLGHWLLGRRAKALLFFVTITATFLAGVLLAQGRNLDYSRDEVYFYAYAFNLGETALAWLLARGLERDREIALLNVGFLYTAVACLLNLVAMMDCLHTCRYAGGPLPGRPKGGGAGEGEAGKEQEAPL